MKRKIFSFNDQANNINNMKRTAQLFDELDEMIKGFGIKKNNNKSNIPQPPIIPSNQSNNSPIPTSPKKPFKPVIPKAPIISLYQNGAESKSHIIPNPRVHITNEPPSFGKSLLPNKPPSKDFNLDEIDIDAYFDSPPSLVKNSNSKTKPPLSQFPINLIIKHNQLNSVQENSFELLFNTSHNSLITAPTGSGKTVLFEMAIARVIKTYYNRSENSLSNKNFKVIYLAPIKSLCQEKAFEWKMTFSKSPLDLKVVEATGDSEYINMAQMSSANIILTTPERFDVLTRKWKENPQFIASICLLLIDEIHLLNEECRGATIEAIVARMKLLSTMTQFKGKELEKHRTIALSATIPNIPEVAEFLQVQNLGLKIFGEEYRPVKIERIVFGYQCGKNSNEYMFEKYLDYRIAEIIQKYSEGKPVLVFCQTQKGTINAAKQLVADMNINKMPIIALSSSQEKIKLENLSNRISNKQLSQMVKYGIGFHNAGLSLHDRQLVEENFKASLIKIICTTSTLAQGVNLPARLVIIKSTNCYRGPKIGYTEYNKMEIDQMVGRAGRPQYDNKGIAIIMTEKEKVDKFNELSSTMIESHLKENIVEHINAEIATGTIADVDSAVNWIKNTFMYVRMKNSPAQFGIRPSMKKRKNEVINEYLKEMCVKIFKDLQTHSLITFDVSNHTAIANPLCKKMSKNYVMFETMKIISEMVSENAKNGYQYQIEENILSILSNSKEFSKYSSKIDERKTLNSLNKDEIGIKYKVKGSIDTSSKKAYILLQANLSGIIIDHWELRRQQNEISQSAIRILNCLREYYKFLNDSRGYIASLLLKKCINNGMWSESDLLMKQLPKIGDKLAKNFIRSGINSFDKLIKENPRKIENICGKNAPFGNILIDIAKSIPKIDIAFEIVKVHGSIYKLCININVPWGKYYQDDFDPYTCYHIVICDSYRENEIRFKKKVRPSSSNKVINFTISQINIKHFPLSIYIICDKFIGMDKLIIIKDQNDTNGTVSTLQKSINLIGGKRGTIATKKKDNIEIDEEDIVKLMMIEEDKENQKETEFAPAGKRRARTRNVKKKKENIINEEEHVSQQNTKIQMQNVYGKHLDLKDMIENMKTDYKQQNFKYETNLKLKEIRNYELNVNNMSTEQKSPIMQSTQNLLDKLKETKTLNLNLSFLDNFSELRKDNKTKENKNDFKKSILNLNLDDIL